MQSTVFNIADYEEQIITVYPRSHYQKSSNYLSRRRKSERKQKQEEKSDYYLAQKFCGLLICILGLVIALVANFSKVDELYMGTYICVLFGAFLIVTKERGL